ncbi:hypothetical protein [Caballeronia sp. dw_19]|uniref:hypothetical protein n=1 Tax=Caballeronia sp. dw_19 TaxID=2719791 RepID=UPI001BD50C53|nr:hypothetical protein [Caballeronia sp. dw_19]
MTARRERILYALQQIYALLGAPLAWIVQICVCEALAAQACYPAQDPLAHPDLHALGAYIGAVSLVCLAVALGGLTAAWRGWRTLRQGAGTNPDRRAGRFLFHVAILSSPMFVLGLLVTAMAALIVSPCKPW